MTLAVIVTAGALIGLSLGALGGGGFLVVPALVLLLLVAGYTAWRALPGLT